MYIRELKSPNTAGYRRCTVAIDTISSVGLHVCMYICMHVGMLLTQAGINTKLHLFIYDTDISICEWMNAVSEITACSLPENIVPCSVVW